MKEKMGVRRNANDKTREAGPKIESLNVSAR